MNKRLISKIWNKDYNNDEKIIDILVKIYKLGYNDAKDKKTEQEKAS